MAATATDYSAKCDRLGVLRGDLKKRQEEAEAAGKFTPEGMAKFDELCKEFAALKEDILGADALTQAKQFVHDCDLALDAPRKVPTTPEEIEADLTAARQDITLRRTSGQRLRFFTPYGKETAAMAKNRKSALLCGLGLLTQVKLHCDWARAKLAAMGLGPDKLAQISPFMGEDGQSTGGYLVFPEFERTMINLKEIYGVLQREAYKVPMGSDTLNIPRRAGGTTVYYPEENTLIPASAMAFDKVMLIAKKYAQLALWSSELNDDSVIAFTDLLTAEMAYQFTKAEDFNGAQGDGTSTYAGVVGFLQALAAGKSGIVPTASVASITAALGWTSPALWLAGATTVQILTFWNQLVGTLPVYAEGRAKWYMHKTVFWGLIAPVIESAGGNIAMYLTTGIPLKFLGYDIEMMQAMPTFSQLDGTSATPALQMAAVLGDMLNTCFMGERTKGTKVITSNERFMEYDQLAIQVSQRVAINNVVGDSVLPAQQAGPMVGLKFPAT